VSREDSADALSSFSRLEDSMRANETSRVQPVYLPTRLLWLALLTCACGSAREDAPSSHSVPIPGCEMLDVTPCDTQAHDCQLSRLELAACLRGTDAGTLPKVNVMTEQAYVDYINTGPAARPLLGTNHFEVAMTWLGLAEPGSFRFVPLETEDVADWFGAYRWRHKEVLVLDHGRPADDAASNVELVAALIQALRDRDTNIAMWTTAVSIFDVDSTWGGDAMYFGEARFYSNRYQAALEGRGSELDESTRINEGIREDIDWIRTQPSSYVATNSRFAHNFGARAAYLAWQRNGVAAVDTLYDSKLITQQLMASEAEEGPAPTLKYHARPRAPGEWDQDPTVTALGAWGLYLSLSRHLELAEAWPLALDWSGEQLFVFKGAEGSEDETAMVWQLEMANDASAAALEAALTSNASGAQVQRIGTFVTLAIASSDAPLDWAFVVD
jgi:hypothetical protein